VKDDSDLETVRELAAYVDDQDLTILEPLEDEAESCGGFSLLTCAVLQERSEMVRFILDEMDRSKNAWGVGADVCDTIGVKDEFFNRRINLSRDTRGWIYTQSGENVLSYAIRSGQKVVTRDLIMMRSSRFFLDAQMRPTSSKKQISSPLLDSLKSLLTDPSRKAFQMKLLIFPILRVTELGGERYSMNENGPSSCLHSLSALQKFFSVERSPWWGNELYNYSTGSDFNLTVIPSISNSPGRHICGAFEKLKSSKSFKSYLDNVINTVNYSTDEEAIEDWLKEKRQNITHLICKFSEKALAMGALESLRWFSSQIGMVIQVPISSHAVCENWKNRRYVFKNLGESAVLGVDGLYSSFNVAGELLAMDHMRMIHGKTNDENKGHENDANFARRLHSSGDWFPAEDDTSPEIFRLDFDISCNFWSPFLSKQEKENVTRYVSRAGLFGVDSSLELLKGLVNPREEFLRNPEDWVTSYIPPRIVKIMDMISKYLPEYISGPQTKYDQNEQTIFFYSEAERLKKLNELLSIISNIQNGSKNKVRFIKPKKIGDILSDDIELNEDKDDCSKLMKALDKTHSEVYGSLDSAAKQERIRQQHEFGDLIRKLRSWHDEYYLADGTPKIYRHRSIPETVGEFFKLYLIESDSGSAFRNTLSSVGFDDLPRLVVLMALDHVEFFRWMVENKWLDLNVEVVPKKVAPTSSIRASSSSECIICLDPIAPNHRYRLLCGHEFHHECIQDHIAKLRAVDSESNLYDISLSGEEDFSESFARLQRDKSDVHEWPSVPKSSSGSDSDKQLLHYFYTANQTSQCCPICRQPAKPASLSQAFCLQLLLSGIWRTSSELNGSWSAPGNCCTTEPVKPGTTLGEGLLCLAASCGAVDTMRFLIHKACVDPETSTLCGKNFLHHGIEKHQIMHYLSRPKYEDHPDPYFDKLRRTVSNLVRRNGTTLCLARKPTGYGPTGDGNDDVPLVKSNHMSLSPLKAVLTSDRRLASPGAVVDCIERCLDVGAAADGGDSFPWWMNDLFSSESASAAEWKRLLNDLHPDIKGDLDFKLAQSILRKPNTSADSSSSSSSHAGRSSNAMIVDSCNLWSLLQEHKPADQIADVIKLFNVYGAVSNSSFYVNEIRFSDKLQDLPHVSFVSFIRYLLESFDDYSHDLLRAIILERDFEARAMSSLKVHYEKEITFGCDSLHELLSLILVGTEMKTICDHQLNNARKEAGISIADDVTDADCNLGDRSNIKDALISALLHDAEDSSKEDVRISDLDFRRTLSRLEEAYKNKLLSLSGKNRKLIEELRCAAYLKGLCQTILWSFKTRRNREKRFKFCGCIDAVEKSGSAGSGQNDHMHKASCLDSLPRCLMKASIDLCCDNHPNLLHPDDIRGTHLDASEAGSSGGSAIRGSEIPVDETIVCLSKMFYLDYSREKMYSAIERLNEILEKLDVDIRKRCIQSIESGCDIKLGDQSKFSLCHFYKHGSGGENMFDILNDSLNLFDDKKRDLTIPFFDIDTWKPLRSLDPRRHIVKKCTQVLLFFSL